MALEYFQVRTLIYLVKWPKTLIGVISGFQVAVFYGNTADTSDYEVSWISNGQCCAIFYAKKVDDTYYLTNYTFTADTIKGYMIFVGE